VPLSVLYKQFFAGELEVLCSLPEFWRKVSILYSGGDDFAVYGSWDALIALAREVQRLFHRFTEENLKDYPGAEGKTISMADRAGAGDVLSAGRRVRGRRAQSGPGEGGRQGLHLPAGPHPRMAAPGDAAELKDTVTRLIHDFRMSKQFLYQLRSFYRREAYAGGGGGNPAHLAFPAAVQSDSERHARPRISKAAHAFDQ
jgi:CRISPR-associated protein Csm1